MNTSKKIPDPEFWQNINVSPRELEKLDYAWYSKLKSILEAHEGSEQQKIFSFLNEPIIDIENIPMLKKICLTENAIILYALWKYQTGKIEILKEFFNQLQKSIKFTNKDNVLLSLLELYPHSKKLIHDSYIYYLFRKTPLLETLSTDPAISEDHISQFISMKEKVIRRANKKLKHKNRIAHVFGLNNCHYFYFEKANKEVVVSGYGEKKLILKKDAFFIMFNISNNIVEIHSRNKTVSDVFSSILWEMKLKLFDSSLKPINEDISQKINSIITISDDNLELKEIKYRHLEKGVNAQTNLKQLKNDPPLKNTIQLLIDEGFIDPNNFRSIQDITFNFNGFIKSIQIENNKDSVKFILKPDGLAIEKYREMCKLFTEKLRIVPNVEYFNLNLSNEEKKRILHGLIGKYTSRLSKKEIFVFDEIKATGILKIQEERKTICSIDRFHQINKDDVTCPVCGATLTSLIPKEVIRIDENQLIKYLHNRFIKIYKKSASIITPKSQAMNKYLQIKTIKTDVIVYPQHSQSIKSHIKKWEDDFIPTVQVIIGKNNIKYSDLKLVSKLYLYDLLFDDVNTLKNKFENAYSYKYNEIINEKIKPSKEVIKSISDGNPIVKSKRSNEKGDAFEDAAYPLLHKLFYEIQRMGKSHRFKTVPDGIMGIKLGPKKLEAFTMMYDFKYSDSSYDLKKLQAKDYIQRANQSKSVKQFSGELSTFLIIGHNVTDRRFINYAENAYTLRKWKKGKCVLIRSSDLLTMYEEFDKLYGLFPLTKIAFNKAFSQVIKKEKERTIIFNDDIIKKIIDTTKQINDTFDVNCFYEHMKSNITD